MINVTPASTITLSDIARANQPLLFAIDPMLNATTNASACNAYGTAAQIIVCETLNLRPIPINGRFKVCFDAEDDIYFYEIKSVRSGCKVVIYNWRIEKELAANVPVNYAFLIHKLCNVKRDVVSAMRVSKPLILILPLGEVKRVFDTCPTYYYIPKTTAQKRLGYARAGYIDGYCNVPITALLQCPTQRTICL